jgi:two-component system, sensor histidine kinase
MSLQRPAMAPEPPPPAPTRDDLILAERVRGLYGSTPAIALAGTVLPPVIALLFWDLMRWPQSIIWVVGVVLTSGLWTLLLNFAFQRRNRLPQDSQRWLNRFMLRSAIAGFVWGMFVITDAHDTDTSAIVGGASLIGLGAIVVSTLSYYPPVHRVFSLGLFSPFIVWALLLGSPTAQVMAGLAAGGMLYTMRASRNLGRMIVESLNTRFENRELIAELQVQKELLEATRDEAVHARDAAEDSAHQAEAARAEAVQANQAKSRFLAAASHDLRQPVHALGLFAAAARTHVQGAQGQAIMDKIDASIDSTEALFNALLDVSRLDAGIMVPDVQPFALDDLLGRLVDEYAPRAAAKALHLRWRPSGSTVSSDLALLERVLRNYLSNAIRYTRQGGILLACRTRGSQIRIEVWDTGVGIAGDKLNDIFQEFFQIGNPERNKANGLGLGLAIVMRIGKLLDHPIAVTSRFYRGSKFSVTVPLAQRLGADAPSTPGTTAGRSLTPPDESLLVGATVLVIDDESVVLQAVEMLLRQWGCFVVTAQSQSDALQALNAIDRTPDVILCDYRLQGPETGITVVKELRHLLGPVSAALITGDTAPDRLLEATHSGLPLLHKPVNALQLKTCLCQLLGSQAGAAGAVAVPDANPWADSG